jgi:methyl-accepting chemotaxis protein
MSITSKLRTGFMIIIIFFLVQSGITYFYISSSRQLVSEAVDRSFEQSQFVLQLALDGQKLRRFEKEHFIYITDASKRDKYHKEWTEAKESIERRLIGAIKDDQGTWSTEDRVELGLWEQSLNAYSDGFQRVHRMAERGSLTSTTEANEKITQAKNAFRTFLEGTDTLGKAKIALAKQAAKDIDANFGVVYIAIFLTSAAGIILLLALSKFIPGSITRPVNELAHAAEKMSKGDLDQKIHPSNIKEFRILSETLERMRISQKTLIDRMLSKA